ncbi:MAG: hypothetical protein IKL41_08110, partial [Clostridia bacterium]|nr:hypothetical protein [Clostridia bacterium]
ISLLARDFSRRYFTENTIGHFYFSFGWLIKIQVQRLRNYFFAREVSKAQVILCVLPSILERYGEKRTRKICILNFFRHLII